MCHCPHTIDGPILHYTFQLAILNLKPIKLLTLLAQRNKLKVKYQVRQVLTAVLMLEQGESREKQIFLKQQIEARQNQRKQKPRSMRIFRDYNIYSIYT